MSLLQDPLGIWSRFARHMSFPAHAASTDVGSPFMRWLSAVRLVVVVVVVVVVSINLSISVDKNCQSSLGFSHL